MYKNYEVVKEAYIKALNGTGTLLKHSKTGARVFVIKNDDNNKVFNVVFRTPPKDDTGLPHILEHSVLCGSRKFPLKDPFVELAKGSMNTFLNAMTYPDKTMYPVASCNDKDFDNLMDVYLDAVFYPNIYKEPRILMQEGWHYELDSMDGDIIYNGVVYNEMKGASSSPEQVLFRQIQAVMFPEHPYGYDSGGDPYAIPSLTLDDFKAFHSDYYHPSNSFIYLYGDMDMEKKLAWLDEAYLGAFDKRDIDSTLVTMPAFGERQYEKKKYAVSSDTSLDKKTYLSYNVAFDQPDSHCAALGLEILEYLLLEAPGAPLKEALQDLGIAEDIFGSYDSGLNQPIFSIVAKNANPEDEAIFVETIEKTLAKVAEEGIDRRKIEAAINNFEFKTREADFGQYPKGIIYSIKALDTWLYDRDPFTVFEYDEAFDEIRKGVENGCFQGLIKAYLLDNSHCAVLQLVPDCQLLEAKEEEIKVKLAEYKASLSEEDKEALIATTKDLKLFQETPDSPEDVATIPMLSKEDISSKAKRVMYDVVEEDGVKYLSHLTFTNHIVYSKLLFDFSHVAFEELSKLSLMAKLLTKIDTERYSYSSLSDEINIHTGGISVRTNIYGVNNKPDECQARVEVKFKSFGNKVTEAVNLIEEIVSGSKFGDVKRIYDLISEMRSRQSMSLIGSGHQAAMNRAMSYHNLPAKYRDVMEGISFYRFIEGIDSQEKVAMLVDDLKDLAKRVFTRSELIVMINSDESMVETTKKTIKNFTMKLDGAVVEDSEESITFEVKNEGFKSSSKVQFNALTGDYVAEGYTYNGAMRVLQTIMSLDYMWTEVRVKGGAYGGFGGFRRSGVFYLGSYRDPNLIKTYEIYKQLPDYIRNIKLDDREMTKYIIGTISQLDTPMTPSMKGEKALNMYMSKITNNDYQNERDEILECTSKDLNALAVLVEKLIAQDNICVIGNEGVVEKEKAILGEVKPLFNV